MRQKLNLQNSATGRVAGKLSIPQMPVEWLDAGTWRLPSGQALAEFALRSGFVAPLLFRTPGVPRDARSGSARRPSLGGSVLAGQAKDFGKGNSR